MKEVLVDRQVRVCDSGCVNEFTKEDLCFCMSRFIREIKKIDNTEYPSNTLHEIVLMIQMHLHQNNVFWKLLDDVEFI